MTGSPPADTPSPLTPEPPASKPRFGFTVWMCNTIEMFERLSYYTLRPVAAIYIAQAADPGGLHLTQAHKGWIYLWWAVFQSLFPMFTGGFADRYGYRKVLAFALTLNCAGYVLMACFHNYYGFFAGIIVLAIGTAFFKPGLQGTLAHCLTKENSSVGWGLFYWIVNVGAFIGHAISPLLLGDPKSWRGYQIMFLTCAGFTFINLLLLFKFPNVPSGASQTESPWQVLARTMKNLLDLRLVTWLLIMSCFWMMMYQLWDLQPNFIEDWVDSSKVAAYVPFDKWREIGPDGQPRVAQQILLSLNSALIVLFVVPMTWMVRRMRTLSTMTFGMLGATTGVLVAGLTGNGWVLLLGIFFFSVGEMLTGPKKSEYLGLIAPPGKKGLYLGYVNIPTGIGQGVGAWIAAEVYGSVGEKATLALKYLMEHTSFGQGKVWDGSVSTLEQAAGVTREQSFAKLQEVLGVSGPQATQILWDTYDPQYGTWLPFAAIGVVAAIALAVFGQLAKRWKDMNA